jgi:hypothetical protein
MKGRGKESCVAVACAMSKRAIADQRKGGVGEGEGGGLKIQNYNFHGECGVRKDTLRVRCRLWLPGSAAQTKHARRPPGGTGQRGPTSEGVTVVVFESNGDCVTE